MYFHTIEEDETESDMLPLLSHKMLLDLDPPPMLEDALNSAATQQLISSTLSLAASRAFTALLCKLAEMSLFSVSIDFASLSLTITSLLFRLLVRLRRLWMIAATSNKAIAPTAMQISNRLSTKLNVLGDGR